MRRDPAVFEVVSEHRYERDTLVVGWRSRVFNASQYLELRPGWRGDPYRLVQFIEELVGATLEAFHRTRARSGQEMVQALLPHFERAIFDCMERIEYEAMDRPRDRVRMDMLYGYQMVRPRDMYFGWDMAAPAEDPKAKEKARQLLLRNLDAGQENSFKKDGSFRVTAKDGKVYTISTARSFNVKAEDGTKSIAVSFKTRPSRIRCSRKNCCWSMSRRSSSRTRTCRQHRESRSQRYKTLTDGSQRIGWEHELLSHPEWSETMTLREIFYFFFLAMAVVFALLGFWAITPITQVVDAATSLSQDRIFKTILLLLIAAVAVKP